MTGCGDGCYVDAAAAKHAPYVRAMWLVVVMNAGMFVVGVIVAIVSGSVAVRADLLDFFSDAVATSVGLLLVGKAPTIRSKASLWQGVVIGALGVYALTSAAFRIVGGEVPEPQSMGVYGILGLCVNVGSALMLYRFRKGDSGVRAVWLYSRNDAIGNVAVLAAAGIVAVTATRWPDVVVGFVLAVLFLQSAYKIIQAARRELRQPQVSSP